MKNRRVIPAVFMRPSCIVSACRYTAAMAKSSTPAGQLVAMSVLENPDVIQLKAIYVVHGTEDFLRAAVISAIRDRVLGSADEFSLTRFDGKSATLADVFDELATLPFLGGHRLVIVDGADDFVSEHRAALERYVGQPHRTGVLVLVTTSWPSNTRLAKLIAQSSSAIAIDAKPLETAALTTWCRQWAKRRYGKRLMGDAAQLLVELVPESLGQFDAELDKLAAYVGDRGDIRVEDVDQLVAAGRVDTVWKILDAAACGDAASALQLLDSLLGTGEQPLLIFGAISSQLRKLAKAYRLVTSGESPRAALSSVGVPPYFVEKVQAQLRFLGRERLGQLYRWLSQTDLGLKGDSALAPQHLLERLLVRVAARTA